MSSIEIDDHQVVLADQRLRVVWNRFGGTWQFHAGGGIFGAGRQGTFKLAEMMEGAYVITDADGKEYGGSVVSFEREADGLVARLGQVEAGGVTWTGIARWRLAAQGRLRWRYELTPSGTPPDGTLVSVHFNMLPSQWRTNSFASCRGYFGDVA